MLYIALFIALISNALATGDTATAEISDATVTVEGAGGDYYRKKGPVCRRECEKNEICVVDDTYIGKRRLGGSGSTWSKDYIKGRCVSKCGDRCARDEECVEDKRRGGSWRKDDKAIRRRLGGHGWYKPEPEPEYVCKSRCRNGEGCRDGEEVCLPKKYPYRGGGFVDPPCGSGPGLIPCDEPVNPDEPNLDGPPNLPSYPAGERRRRRLGFDRRPSKPEYECRCADGYYWNKWAEAPDSPSKPGKPSYGWGKNRGSKTRRLGHSGGKSWSKPSGRCELKCPGGCVNGECKRTLYGTYECDCDWNFEGPQCTEPITPCDPNPCGGGGWFGKGTNTECVEIPERPGYKCVDPCKDVDGICNDGICVNTPKDGMGFICVCNCPANGDNCENDCAEDADCPGDSTCVNTDFEDPDSPLICDCPFGDDVNMCTNPCNDNFCVNGMCSNDDMGNPVCTCDDGWDNADGTENTPCTEDIDECEIDNPCENGGECIDRPNGEDPTCCCRDDFSGPICDVPVGPSPIPIPKPCDTPLDECPEGTTCNNVENSDGNLEALCTCPEGQAKFGEGLATRCSESSGFCPGASEGDGIECDDNARCTPGEGDIMPMCECEDGYEGDGLTTGTGCSDIDECEENTDDCVSKARCINTDGSFECQCRFGYKGDGKESGTGCRRIIGGGGGLPGLPGRPGSSSDDESSDSDDDDDDDGDDARVGLYDNYDHNSLSDVEYNNDIKSDEPNENNIKWTLDIPPWVLYASASALMVFIIINYALCWYRNVMTKNNNHRNTNKEVKINEDEDSPLSDDA